MTDSWQAAAGWLGHTALVGAAVLLLGWLGVLLVSGPARRQRLAAWAVRAAVLVPALCLLPAWLTVPAPDFLRDEVCPEPQPSAPAPAEAAPAAEPSAADAGTEEAEPGWGWVSLPPTVAAFDDRPAPPAAEPQPAPAPAPATAPPVAEPQPSRFAAVVPLLLGVYLLVAAGLLGQLLLGQLALARLVRSGRPAPGWLRELLDELSADLPRRPRLLVCDRLASPVCFGLWRPTVLVPGSLAKPSAEPQLRWVLAHELDHVRRGDPATGWWAGVARAVYFFVPWFWPLRRELALAQEYLADAAAAAADGRPIDYAAFLVDLSGRPARVPLLAHAARAGRSDLFRRVTMLLKTGAGLDRRCPRTWAALAAGGVLSAAVLLSGVGLAVAEDPKPREEKRVEEKRVEKKSDDRKADEKRSEKKDAQPERRRDGDRRDADDVAGIKQAIADAAKKGDVDEVRRQVDRLERALSARRPAFPRAPDVPFPPGVPAPPNFQFRFGGPDAERMNDRMKEAMEKSLKGFEKALDKLGDNPEARDQLKRAMDEYRRAMEEGLKRGGNARDRGPQRNPENPFGGPLRRGDRQPGGGVRFGVGVAPVPELLAAQFDLPEGRGLVVREVLPDTPAAKAGLEKGDVIVSFAGKPVPGDPERFPEMVAQAKAGQPVDVGIVRKGKKETVKVELPAAPRRTDVLRGSDFEARPRDRNRVAFESMAVRINNNDFQIDAKTGDASYRLTGTLDGGKAAPSKIEVTSGGKKSSYKSVDDVPEEHRAAVRQLLSNVGGSGR